MRVILTFVSTFSLLVSFSFPNKPEVEPNRKHNMMLAVCTICVKQGKGFSLRYEYMKYKRMRAM